MKILISIILLMFSGTALALEPLASSAPKGWGEEASGEPLSIDTMDIKATRLELTDITSSFINEKNCLQSINLNLLNHCPSIVACTVTPMVEGAEPYMIESYSKDDHCFTAQEEVDPLGKKTNMTQECRYSEAEALLMATGYFFEQPEVPADKMILGMKYRGAVNAVHAKANNCRVTKLPFKAVSQAAREKKNVKAKKTKHERRVIMKPPINPPPDDWWNEY